jgi:hypothetical protein
MKRITLLLVLAFLLPVTLFAQNVPNGGFESWTNGNPDNWYADNSAIISAFPVTQSSIAHSGSSSAKGTVISYIGGILGPVLQAGATASGFAITQRFKTATGYYQFNPVSGDRLGFNFLLYKAGTPIASGAAMITAAASSWTQFNIDFSYFTNDVPDNCILQILIDGPNGSDYHVGSYFLLDDLNLTGTAATSVIDKNIIPAKFSLEQNYPNPFNPSTKIRYNLLQNSFVNLKVYNAIGTEVASLVNSVMPAGTHEVVFDALGLNSGVYFYTLKTGDNFIQTKKMILMK